MPVMFRTNKLVFELKKSPIDVNILKKIYSLIVVTITVKEFYNMGT
jgi:hypothetical protein